MTSVKVAATKVAHCQSLDCKGHTFEMSKMSKCSDVFFSDMHGFWGRTSTIFFVFFSWGWVITTKKMD